MGAAAANQTPTVARSGATPSARLHGRRGRQQIGHHDHRDTSRVGRDHAIVAVLQRQAMSRRQAQVGGGGEIGFGVRFAVGHIVAADDADEMIAQAGVMQMAVRLALRRGGDQHGRDAGCAHLCQQFGRARLQWPARTPLRRDAGGDGGAHDSIVQSGKAILHPQPAGGFGQSDQRSEIAGRHGKARVCHHRDHHIADQPLAIEQQPVHIEQDGAGAGGDHAVGCCIAQTSRLA